MYGRVGTKGLVGLNHGTVTAGNSRRGDNGTLTAVNFSLWNSRRGIWNSHRRVLVYMVVTILYSRRY